ncbi:MAG: hypothetical protein KC516_02320 [Nanoarchaeota archaeon]|nr:hypothetical protein [Nanoarchaeota archaeon]
MKLLEVFSNVGGIINPIDFASYWYLPGNFDKDLESDTLISVISTIDCMYDRRDGYQSNHYIREIIKNARVHGGAIEGKDTFCGLFMNKHEFCFGSNDGGNYFKRPDIKDIWENRKELNEFHKPSDPKTGFHLGYGLFLKDWKGKLFVDNQFGTIYITKKFMK